MSCPNTNKSVPVFPHTWKEIVNGSIEEDFSEIALSTLRSLIREDFIPPIEHIQFVLHCASCPPAGIDSDLPISILNRLLSFHSPGAFADCIPCHPSNCSMHKMRQGSLPQWLQWDYKRSSPHRAVYESMKRCLTLGIWGLLYVNQGDFEEETKERESRKEGSKAKEEQQGYVQESPLKTGYRHNVNRDVDLEDSTAGERTISFQGWLLLEWLVAVWERDALEKSYSGQEGQLAFSPIFLQQLPRSPGMLQRDDAMVPLRIIRDAFQLPENGDAARRREVAVRLLNLLLSAAIYLSEPIPQSPPKPLIPSISSFHPSSLLSSLIHTFSPLPSLFFIYSAPFLAKHISYRPLAHVYTLLIEEWAGLGKKKGEERQKLKQKRKASGEINGFEQGWNGLNAPTLIYLCTGVLSLKPLHESSDNIYKVNFIKLSLLTVLLSHPDYLSSQSAPDIISRLKAEQEWRNDIIKSLKVPKEIESGEPEAAKSIERVSRMVEILLRRLIP
ncbi:hypothetical protein L204_102900 [Cryptococcus depauperatus]|nr:hypothetical protein L204_00355 [Cryptococcus depauperatus CBS 7855]